jgi:hypothetical protein
LVSGEWKNFESDLVWTFKCCTFDKKLYSQTKLIPRPLEGVDPDIAEIEDAKSRLAELQSP